MLPLGLIEVARTGIPAIMRGPEGMSAMGLTVLAIPLILLGIFVQPYSVEIRAALVSALLGHALFVSTKAPICRR